MGKFKVWVAKKVFSDIINVRPNIEQFDASSSSNRETIYGIIKKIGLRFGDVSNSKDYEEPEFDLESIKEGCNVDAYLRQGVDKYVDQIFKEGYRFYGKDEGAVEYIKLRLGYMAEATDVPTEVFLIEIAEDIVKYSNCIIAKSRSNDPNAFPQGSSVTGLNDKDPVAGYFLINPTTTKVRRDKNGTVKGWQQEIQGADKPVKMNPEDVVHMYYKREKGNAYGTPFLLPVLNDVRALREAEDNVLKMMYRNIYPFLHAMVGDDNKPGSTPEIDSTRDAFESMEVDGGLVTSNRVKINAVDTNKVINAEPYLRYMEDRIFSGMGIPGILFGRGGTANRSTGDNMSNEMSDRIRAIQNVIETFINFKIVKELLLEGGYDPILNPDQVVEFKFNDNDIDCQIKEETHAIYKYEHNSITEDEMRNLLGMDPITDRAGMFQTLITQANAVVEASLKTSSEQGNKETNNKQKPTNQHGTKTSPKKTTNSVDEAQIILDTFKNSIFANIGSLSDEYVRNTITLCSVVLKDKINCVDVDEVSNALIDKEFFKFSVMITNELEHNQDIATFTNIVEVFVDNLIENIQLIINVKEEQ